MDSNFLQYKINSGKFSPDVFLQFSILALSLIDSLHETSQGHVTVIWCMQHVDVSDRFIFPVK